jgi:hypothetical protein
MIIYLLIKAFDSLLFAIISLIPSFETPVWVVTQLPDVLFRIASFNWYLPVYETAGIVIRIDCIHIKLQNSKNYT